MGVWAAYDRAAAWDRFWALVVGVTLAVVVSWFGHRGGARTLAWAGVACALLAGALGTYFLLTYQWTPGPGKFAPLQAAGQWIQAYRPALPVPEDINANVAASGLIILLWLGTAGLEWFWRRSPWRGLVVLAALAWLAGGLALVMSVSRGAWLGMVAGGLAIVYLAVRRRWYRHQPRRVLLDGLAMLALVALAVAFVAAVRVPGLAEAAGRVNAGGEGIGRSILWRDGLDLVSDYPFTGSGLGSTMMVYSTYGRLLHVGFITHMHNLFVQIAVEQGVFGLAAFLGLLALGAWSVLRATSPACAMPVFGYAAGAALAALVVHGMTDVGAYGSLLAVVMFLPIGFAVGAAALAGSEGLAGEPARLWVPVALVMALVLVLVVLVLPGGQAALQANLGAVSQTRAELGVYEWPRWPIQDELRRSAQVDLGPSLARYQAALARDPLNATANRRLGQIELSRGDYERARLHLEAAYGAAPGQRATRQLLGESYAIAGDVDRAARLWQPLELSEDQREIRAWWYEHIGEPERAEDVRQAMMEARND
jgi:putative inorganic carbon (HCO3(-)) transporter